MMFCVNISAGTRHVNNRRLIEYLNWATRSVLRAAEKSPNLNNFDI